jgi:threonyl-tRNA synthetase
MSKTSAFLFTNTTAESGSVTPKQLGLVTNYAVERNTAKRAQLNNKTAPLDAQEVVSYTSRDLATVNTSIPVLNPAKVKSGIMYTIEIEDILVTTDSDDASFRVDEPIVASLQIRHGKSGNITSDIVAQVVTRLISACRHNNGTWRFGDLMRSAECPVTD